MVFYKFRCIILNLNHSEIRAEISIIESLELAGIHMKFKSEID